MKYYFLNYRYFNQSGVLPINQVSSAQVVNMISKEKYQSANRIDKVKTKLKYKYKTSNYLEKYY